MYCQVYKGCDRATKKEGQQLPPSFFLLLFLVLLWLNTQSAYLQAYGLLADFAPGLLLLLLTELFRNWGNKSNGKSMREAETVGKLISVEDMTDWCFHRANHCTRHEWLLDGIEL